MDNSSSCDILKVTGGLSKRCPFSFMLMDENTAKLCKDCRHTHPFHKDCLQMGDTCLFYNCSARMSTTTLVSPKQWLALYSITPSSRESLCTSDCIDAQEYFPSTCTLHTRHPTRFLIDLTLDIPSTNTHATQTPVTKFIRKTRRTRRPRPFGCKHLLDTNRASYHTSTFSACKTFLDHLISCSQFLITNRDRSCTLCKNYEADCSSHEALVMHLFEKHPSLMRELGAYYNCTK